MMKRTLRCHDFGWKYVAEILGANFRVSEWA